MLRLVMGQTLRLTVAGLAFGVVAAAALARALGSLLYGVGSADPVTFAAVVLLLASVALLASWIPVRQAARLDPLTALRAE